MNHFWCAEISFPAVENASMQAEGRKIMSAEFKAILQLICFSARSLYVIIFQLV